MLRYPAAYGTLRQVTIVAGFFPIHFLFLLSVSFVYCRHHGIKGPLRQPVCFLKPGQAWFNLCN
jgi:hypothetical protein